MSSSRKKKNENETIILNLDEVIVLLNELYLESKKDFEIVDCLYGETLLNVQLSEEVKINQLTSVYELNKKHHLIPPEIRGEFPNKHKYFNVFVRSGFFFDAYYKKYFQTILDKINETNHLEGDLPIAIAFDTNLYFKQFFSHVEELLKHKRGSPVYFLLSEGVKKELTAYERKYKPKDIELLKDNAQYAEIIEEFFNQNKLDSRLWHHGHGDFLKCVDQPHTKIVDIDKTITSDDMDSKILEGLIQEINQQNIKLYIFSLDSDFISRAKGNRNVYPVFLDNIPLDKLQKTLKCDWHRLIQTIYNLAITFGAITLRFKDKSEFIIYGIWRGKKYHHWSSESVKIRSTDSIIKSIQTDLRILENMRFKEV